MRNFFHRFAAVLVIVSFSLLTGCDQPPGNESGYTPVPTIRIDSAAELARIGVDDGYPLHGIYILEADIELDAWTPVGPDESRPFRGTFDGGGRTVTLNRFTPARPYSGIFGCTDGATLENVTLAGNVGVSWDDTNEKTLFAGALAGYARNTSIADCAGSADVYAVSVKGPVYAGGIAGYCYGATVSGCQTSGTVTASGPGHNSSAGGLTGYNIRGTTIYNCRASGNISLEGIDPESRTSQSYLYMVYAGGLAGYTGDGSVITGSYATGDVYASSPYPYAGGLVGYNYGILSGSGVGSRIASSYAAGGVTALAVLNGLPYAGGLAGYNSGDKTTIENCYATGLVHAETEGGSGWAGGITGANANHALVSKCYSSSAVEVKVGTGALPFNQPGVSEGACGGGIAGYSYFTADTKIENCAALGPTVNGTAENGILALHRVTGRNGDAYVAPILSNNIGNQTMTIDPPPDSQNKTPTGLDGADCELNPALSVYEGLGWDFTTVWEMNSTNPYPILQWQ
jgi:hypothetical protein